MSVILTEYSPRQTLTIAWKNFSSNFQKNRNITPKNDSTSVFSICCVLIDINSIQFDELIDRLMNINRTPRAETESNIRQANELLTLIF